LPNHLTLGSALCEAQLAVRVFRDDLPSVKVSRLRARGEITAESTHAFVRFGEIEFVAGVTLRRFRNGGSWSLFLCPVCNGRAQVLWLLDGRPACRRCCIARGVRWRVEPMSIYKRAAHRIPKLIAQLNNPEPARLHPRPGRTMDRRSRLEVALSASMLTLRKGRLRGLAKALEDE
jgi:hypothetical protein